ncbi:hypothetical protein A343_1039 [Porphyromonas gingivalis JCVI SC001]|nr:hypothetical protein A343_1039 [Porphyromonas gingivalis JCVI SC001]
MDGLPSCYFFVCTKVIISDYYQDLYRFHPAVQHEGTIIKRILHKRLAANKSLMQDATFSYRPLS